MAEVLAATLDMFEAALPSGFLLKDCLAAFGVVLDTFEAVLPTGFLFSGGSVGFGRAGIVDLSSMIPSWPIVSGAEFGADK
jgi:hypothetical protein